MTEPENLSCFNQKMEEITGYSMEEANACDDFLAVLYPDPFEYQTALKRLGKLEETHHFHDIETSIRARDGSIKPLFVTTINYS